MLNMQQQPSPSRLRFLRFITLVTLLFSDGTYSILRRYSRGILFETYSVNEVLLVAEFIKLAFSCFMISSTKKPVGHCTNFTNLILQSRKMLILALLYALGNVLSYYSLARIGAGTFVVIANLKTLTMAVFSTLILGNQYSWAQWRALILLVVGVVLFVLPTLKAGGSTSNALEDNEDQPQSYVGNLVLGVSAEIVVVTLSGYASIYFEKAIKHDPFDIWERNFQLGFYSILMYTTLISFEHNVPFSNWTPVAVVLSFLGAAGGLLVALSIKYGDSVLKTLAISGSIIYASIVDHITLGGPMNESMGLSIIVVLIAILNYNFDATPVAPPKIKSKCSDLSDDDDAHADPSKAFKTNDGDAEEIKK